MHIPIQCLFLRAELSSFFIDVILIIFICVFLLWDLTIFSGLPTRLKNCENTIVYGLCFCLKYCICAKYDPGSEILLNIGKTLVITMCVFEKQTLVLK